MIRNRGMKSTVCCSGMMARFSSGIYLLGIFVIHLVCSSWTQTGRSNSDVSNVHRFCLRPLPDENKSDDAPNTYTIAGMEYGGARK